MKSFQKFSGALVATILMIAQSVGEVFNIISLSIVVPAVGMNNGKSAWKKNGNKDWKESFRGNSTGNSERGNSWQRNSRTSASTKSHFVSKTPFLQRSSNLLDVG